MKPGSQYQQQIKFTERKTDYTAKTLKHGPYQKAIDTRQKISRNHKQLTHIVMTRKLKRHLKPEFLSRTIIPLVIYDIGHQNT